MNDKDLHNYCLRWATWRYTRRFYLKPSSMNLLARMQPSKSGREPNARLDADMQHFNSAVSALMTSDEHKPDMACFWSFYVDQDNHIKVVADKMGISRQTYYDRVKRASRKAWRMSIDIADAACVTATLPEVVEID